MRITFFGAAQNVTGSKHLVESGQSRLLFDCGLYQGKRYETYELNQRLPFAAKEITATILSHGHADHCGALPILVKLGYSGKIFATPATIDIARLIMEDSANVQKYDYLRLRSREKQGEKILPPLYTAEEVDKACRYFEPIPYAHKTNNWQALGLDCRFKFYDAGHVLGSAITVIQVDEAVGQKTLAYTGDLGNTHVPLLPEPEIISESIETLIIECTYGDTNHRPIVEVADRLRNIILEAVQNKKKIIVPAFALGRTQELVYILHKLFDQGKIPEIPVYLDSPLANNITDVFAKYSKDFDQETWQDFTGHNESPFFSNNLHYVQTIEESNDLAKKSGPFIVIASSGMAEGGRILRHLEQSVSDPNAIIMITGYQAENTLGRKLQDKVTPVRIYDRLYNVRAQVVTFDELSAHADQAGLLSYISKIKDLQTVFLVHAELPKAIVFKGILEKHFPILKINIPAVGESFEI
jgi:metallo-beta-lactamase family protein